MGALENALKLTHGDRNEDYGEPHENMARIAEIWTGILRASGVISGDRAVRPEDVAMCMIGVKLAREAFKHKQDNLDDMAGYVDVLERTIEGLK